MFSVQYALTISTCHRKSRMLSLHMNSQQMGLYFIKTTLLTVKSNRDTLFPWDHGITVFHCNNFHIFYKHSSVSRVFQRVRVSICGEVWCNCTLSLYNFKWISSTWTFSNIICWNWFWDRLSCLIDERMNWYQFQVTNFWFREITLLFQGISQSVESL